MCTYIYKCVGKSENVSTENNGRKVNIFLLQVQEIQTSQLLVQASQFDIFLRYRDLSIAIQHVPLKDFKVHTFQPNSISGLHF